MLRTRLNILNSPVNSICLQSTPSDWSPLIQYEAKLIAYGGVPPSLAWEYEIPAVIYADKVFVMRDFAHLPTKGVTPDVDTAGWLVFPSGGGTSNPPHTQAFAITTDNSTNTFTPASDTSSNIIFIDATGQFSLATIIIASSSFIGTLTIITRSGSINAVTIQFPNKNDYRTLAVNFTYTYSVTTPDIYTGASTNPRFCTAMSVAGNSIDKAVGGSVDGISTNAVGFFVLKNQVAPEVTDTPDGIYLSTGTLPLIMAVEFGSLPLGSSVYIISGSTNRGKTFSDWVNTQYNNDLNQTDFVINVVADTTELNALPEANDSFAYIPNGNDKGIYAKINNVWQLADSIQSPQTQTITIAGEDETHNITPSSSATVFIVYLNFTVDVATLNLNFLTSTFKGVVQLVNNSNVNTAINTKITQPDNTFKYISILPSTTYTYYVTTPDIYVSGQTPNIIANLRSVKDENIPLTGITTIDGVPLITGCNYYLSYQIPDATHGVNGLYIAISPTEITLTTPETGLPIGTTIYIIGGNTNAGKTIQLWQDTNNNPIFAQTNFNIPVVSSLPEIIVLPVANDNFAYIPNGVDQGMYVKIGGTWQLTAPPIRTKTINIPTLSNGTPQEITLTWDTPFTTNTYNAFVSYVSDENGLISITEKQGSKTQTGVDYIIQNNSQLLTLSNITIAVSGIG